MQCWSILINQAPSWHANPARYCQDSVLEYFLEIKLLIHLQFNEKFYYIDWVIML